MDTKEAERIYDEVVRGHRVTTDSRDVHPGDVFFALRGENFDGNRFAAKAVEDGASAAIVDSPEWMSTPHCVKVPDVLACLQEVARCHRRRLGLPILGITGTNGKTTTKELCHAVLSKRFKTVATRGNLNNHIGVPLTLLSMDKTTEMGIVEMGANHPGEIKTLCDIAEPDFGLITNIGVAHIEGFGSRENIVTTKRALYDHVVAKGGRLFVNGSDELLRRLSEGANRELYGSAEGCFRGEMMQSVPYMVFELKTGKGNLAIRTHLTGGYNFDNAMAASCVGHYFGVDDMVIREAIEGYEPTNGRSQLMKTKRNTVILDAYNANPSSMAASLAYFTALKEPHKVVVLGEMRELGSVSEASHRQVVETVVENRFDAAYLVGRAFEAVGKGKPNVVCFADTEALMQELEKSPVEGACVLVKGSRGNRLERIVDYL